MKCKLLILSASVLAATLCASSLAARPPVAPDAPSFVIIFGDDMPPEHVGAYGGPRKTPAIDALAAKGTRFNEAFCVSSMCTPSRYSLLTARYPGRAQSDVFLDENPIDEPYTIAWNTAITEEELCMGDVFSELGYQTGFVGKWHLHGDVDYEELPKLPADANVADPNIQKILRQRHKLQCEIVSRETGFQFVDSVLWSNFDVAGIVETGLREHNFEWILNGALNFLDQVDKDSPFLLYFASTAVHGPNHLESLYANPHISPAGHVELPVDYYPTRTQILRELNEHTGGNPHHIDAGMLCLDYQVAGIRKKLAERGLDKNTVIIYLSDHGIEPGKATSYLRGTRIPFIATLLGEDNKADTSNEIVQVCDILPTVWDLATNGAAAPEGEWDGISFASVLRGKEFTGREFAYFENGFTRSVYRDGLHYIAWRYPQSVIEKMRSGELTEAPDHLNTLVTAQASITMEEISSYWDPDQLFDVKKDPYETTNQFSNPEYADQLAILQQDLNSVLETFDHPFDLAASEFQNSAKFDKLKQPRINRGTGYIYWYEPGRYAWPPKDKQ